MHQQKLGHKCLACATVNDAGAVVFTLLANITKKAYGPSDIAIASEEQQRVIWEAITEDSGLCNQSLLHNKLPMVAYA
ncbi:MAG: hypothetical protein ACJAUP_000047 [Cellvibrionaceae bacterium]